MAARMGALIDPATKKARDGAIAKVDDHTVKLSLKKPDITIIPGMTDYPGLIVHHDFEKDGKDLVKHPIGTGRVRARFVRGRQEGGVQAADQRQVVGRRRLPRRRRVHRLRPRHFRHRQRLRIAGARLHDEDRRRLCGDPGQVRPRALRRPDVGDHRRAHQRQAEALRRPARAQRAADGGRQRDHSQARHRRTTARSARTSTSRRSTRNMRSCRRSRATSPAPRS